MARAYAMCCDVRFNVLVGESARCPDCGGVEHVTVKPVPGVSEHAPEV